MRFLGMMVAVAFPLFSLHAAEPEKAIDMLKSGDSSPWKKVDKNWIVAGDAVLSVDNPKKLTAKDVSEKGPVWVNGTLGRLPDLITQEHFGDCSVHIEFLIAQGSNSGIKFHAMYEIQILDSYGKKDSELSGDDCGGIYPRAELKPKYHHIDKGIAPKVNAAKPAGQWQSLDVVWQSPRFDSAGKKTAPAKIVKATLNGKVIHENQELLTHTGNNYTKPETAKGPFMIQADHGPVAIRNVRLTPAKAE